jgi:hypothetical protein
MKSKINSQTSNFKEGGFLKANNYKDQTPKQVKQININKSSANQDQILKYFTELKKKPK